MTQLFDDKSAEESIPKYIGEDAKYKTPEELEKGYHHIQKHVETLEEENAKYRDQLQSQTKVEEVLAKLEQKFSPSNHMGQSEGSQDQTHGSSQDGITDKTDRGVTLEDVKNLLVQTDMEKARKANQSSVVNELTKRYGEKAKDIYVAKAEELGLNLDDLAATSPKAVLEFFEDKKGNVPPANTPNRINTVNLQSGTPEYGTFAYWKKLKDEKKISTEEMLRQQHKSILEMGPDRFWQRNN